MFEMMSLSKWFGRTAAVRSVDLAIEPGKTTVLIGPSGCGKSTLLRLMLGLALPDEGTIRFEGETLTPKNILTLRLKMGYVIQDGGLFPHLTARGNVTLVARHLSWSRRGIDRRLDELLKLTHFPAEGLDRYPVQLSGGQCQRVSLMRALLLDPDVLLLDEPLGALDPMVRCSLQEELSAIFRELGKTVVMVTHDLAEADYFGDTVVLMRAGTVVQSGPLSDLLKRPAETFVADFVNAQRGLLHRDEDGVL